MFTRAQYTITTGMGDTYTIVSAGHPSKVEVTLKYLTYAYPGEPLFCIRGRDRLAIPAITSYLGLTAGLTLHGPVEDAIFKDIATVQEWQDSNSGLLKYPDR